MATPGVTVTTSVRGGAATSVNAPSGQFFVVVQSERGPADRALKIRSMSDYILNYGDDTAWSDGYSQINTFFAEGGKQAYVARVVGTSTTKGFLTLQDRAGTPAALLKIEAYSAGAWSSNLTVQVSAGPVTNSYRITVRYKGEIVEDYNSLTTAAQAVAALSSSPYVRATVDPSNTTVAPNNIPAIISATALSAGNDDRANVTAEIYAAGLNLFDKSYGDGSVAIPGQNGSTVYTALVNHAKNNNRLAILGAAVDVTTNALQSAAAGVNSEFAGLFAPWVVIPTSSGATRTISPEGYVAGVRARAHEAVGPWRTPAGAFATTRFVSGLSTIYSLTDFDTLYSAKVSVIRGDGANIRLYGWRSLSSDQNAWFSLKDRDTLNRITTEAYSRLDKYIFEPIDTKGQLLSDIEAELIAIVAPIAEANGLYGHYTEDGDEIDPGYNVSVNSQLNTPQSLARNEIHANLAVRIAPSGDFISLSIIKVGLLDSLV